MNLQVELTKLLIESYDRGVKDATQAAIESFQEAMRLEREECAQIADARAGGWRIAAAIRARGNT